MHLNVLTLSHFIVAMRSSSVIQTGSPPTVSHKENIVTDRPAVPYSEILISQFCFIVFI